MFSKRKRLESEIVVVVNDGMRPAGAQAAVFDTRAYAFHLLVGLNPTKRLRAAFVGVSSLCVHGIVARRFERRSAGRLRLGLETGGLGGGYRGN